MKHTFRALMLGCVAVAVIACASTGAPVSALRVSSAGAQDDIPLEVKSYVGKKPGQLALIERTFSTQPPLIPHSIEGYEIGPKENACWDCHNSDDFKGKKMPMVGKSHLIANADLKADPQLHMSRYQCNTCHVPQIDAPPLVENVFGGDTKKH